MPRKTKPKKRKERFVAPIFEHQRARSRASKKVWEMRWMKSTGPVGDEGRKFLERKYGKDFKEYDVAITDETYDIKPDKKRSPPKKKR